MSVNIFIPARLNSGRLPRKHFKTIGSATVLDWVLGIARNTKLGKIILTTPAKVCNEDIWLKASAEGIPCHWWHGDENDVTGRLSSAQKDFPCDVAVLLSGDAPLTSWRQINATVHAVSTSQASRPVGRGQGFLVSRGKTWQLANDMSTGDYIRHQFPIMFERQDVFTRVYPDPCVALPRCYHRLTLDEPADLTFLRKMFDMCDKCGMPFEYDSVANLLRCLPELGGINAHVRQRGVGDP